MMDCHGQSDTSELHHGGRWAVWEIQDETPIGTKFSLHHQFSAQSGYSGFCSYWFIKWAGKNQVSNQYNKVFRLTTTDLA